MNIGPDFVFLCVPRTASVSISRHWLPNFGGVDQHSDDYHQRVVPPEHAGKFTFAVVRNPYARVRSLWAFLRSFSSGKFSHLTLSDFPWWLMEREDSETQFNSQVQFLAHARLDRVILYEDLPGALLGLPFVNAATVPELPHCNDAPYGRGDWTHGLTRHFFDGVHKFEAASFIEWGYERL